MNTDCDKLHPFLDGELDEAENTAFQRHLATCARCPRELEAAMLVDALTEENAPDQIAASLSSATPVAATPRQVIVSPDPGQPVASLEVARARRSSRRWVVYTVAGVAAAAAAFTLLVRTLSDSESLSGSALVTSLVNNPGRPIEARLAYPGADVYRPYRVLRAAGSDPRRDLPQQPLARMEARGDLHGLGVAHLLAGDLVNARRYLETAGDTPAVLVDRSALALAERQPEQARQLAESVLAKQPGDARALWNLAVALEALDRHAEAAATFDRLVATKERGWADEAAERATAARSRKR